MGTVDMIAIDKEETLVTPILAYRCWCTPEIAPFSPLTSVVFGQCFWYPKCPVEGYREYDPGSDMHSIDAALNGEAGVHGYKTIADLARNYGSLFHNDFYEFKFVCGGVWLWGRIAVHEYGYRAQYAYPAFLLKLDNFPHLPDLELNLAKSYNIPVFEHIDDVPKNLYEREYVWGEWEKREKESQLTQWLYPSQRKLRLPLIRKLPLIGRFLKENPLRPRWSRLESLKKYLRKPVTNDLGFACVVIMVCTFWDSVFTGDAVGVFISLFNVLMYGGLAILVGHTLEDKDTSRLAKWFNRGLFGVVGTVILLILLTDYSF